MGSCMHRDRVGTAEWIGCRMIEASNREQRDVQAAYYSELLFVV